VLLLLGHVQLLSLNHALLLLTHRPRAEPQKAFTPTYNAAAAAAAGAVLAALTAGHSSGGSSSKC
jgi:hypothetical protein